MFHKYIKSTNVTCLKSLSWPKHIMTNMVIFINSITFPGLGLFVFPSPIFDILSKGCNECSLIPKLIIFLETFFTINVRQHRPEWWAWCWRKLVGCMWTRIECGCWRKLVGCMWTRIECGCCCKKITIDQTICYISLVLYCNHHFLQLV